MIADKIHGAYSALVKMRLIVNDESIGITHMGPDFLLIKPSGEHPPGEATIVLQVDDNEDRWTVRLPDGIRAGQNRVRLSK